MCRATVDEIIAVFCRLFDVSELDLLSHSRKQPICLIRQAAMAVAADHLSPSGITLAAIGQRFCRHHSTVFHARELARHDPNIQKLIRQALPHIVNGKNGVGGWLENEVSIGGYIPIGLSHRVTYG